jgi:hypothetical protein
MTHAQTMAPPFSSALRHTRLAPGEYRAELSPAWLVGAAAANAKVNGGLMLAVVAHAALTELSGTVGTELDPLAVSAEFLRAPEPGPVRIRAEVIKTGRTASVVRASMEQNDRIALTTTITAGRLPDDEPVWEELPTLPAEPPSDAVRTGQDDPNAAPMARSADIWLDPGTFRRQDLQEPVVRGWVRPVGEAPDVLFAMFAGDALPPVLYNIGLPGWAPTVQLTALLRARPAPGWLATEIRSRAVGGGWFDEDATVLDSRGRLVCQCRQLALAPLT